jgi:glycerophosphoryl diester phosphodiesterase
MKKRKSSAWLIVSIVLLSGCARVEYYPDKPIPFTKTYWIAHKGGGFFDEGNTREACQYGLSLMDGIEIDLQRSVNNTLWLSHSENTVSCGSVSALCIPGSTDSSIGNLNNCLPVETNYPTLESIFEYVSKNYPDKYISLDVKPWIPCGGGTNIIKQMNEMAQRIIDLVKIYKLENRVMVESDVGDFLYYVKENSTGIETFLTTLGDLELGTSRALASEFSGISFQYGTKEILTKDHVDLLHRKGLKIVIWTIDDEAIFPEVSSLGVDFIQTNNF